MTKINICDVVFLGKGSVIWNNCLGVYGMSHDGD